MTAPRARVTGNLPAELTSFVGQAGRMHHLGIGATHRGKEILAITDTTSVTVIELRTGQVLSTHDIDPARACWRDKQRTPGRWPGPPDT